MKNKKSNQILDKINNKVLPYVVLGALVCGGIFYWIKSYSLKQHYAITIGKVLRYKENSRGPGGSIDYSYQVKGNSYQATCDFPEIYPFGKDSIIGRYFPVAYDTTDVRTSMMLITAKKFKQFSIPFPDSLSWVKQYEGDY
nr:hypothetical protein [uncultured Chitinophaga sp.]